MKRFEFRLHRVLDLRRQHAEAERAQLENLAAASERLAAEMCSLAIELEEARTHVRHAPSAAGEDYLALSHFERHINRRTASVEDRRAELLQKIEKQRSIVLEADRRVKLLQNLEARHRSEWTTAHNKELDALAAESHLARRLSDRRHSAA